MSKFSKLSPLHELCFQDIDETNGDKQIYFTSNIEQVELGGAADVSSLGTYPIRDSIPFGADNVTQIINKKILELFERELDIRRAYGLEDPNLMTYSDELGYKNGIDQALRDNRIREGLLLPFEDSADMFEVADNIGLVTLNTEGSASKLNDKVGVLTDGLNNIEGANVPMGMEVISREELFNLLRELEQNKKYSNSILSIKAAFSASGCGIQKGSYDELIYFLNDENSELSKWFDKNLQNPRQRLMIQEYFTSETPKKGGLYVKEIIGSPGIQFCITDKGYHVIGASNQILANDGITHLGNRFTPELLQNPKVSDAVNIYMQYAYEQGFRGIMGVDLLIYRDSENQIQVAFMEYNARFTGGIPGIFGMSLVTQEDTMNRHFESINGFKVKNVPHEKVREVLLSSEFMPSRDRGVISISNASITNDPATSKIMATFYAPCPREIETLKHNFAYALGL